MSYRGWSNYETWLVALWIDNEEHIQRLWAERAAEIRADHDPDDEPESRWIEELAEELKSDFEENVPAVLLASYGVSGFWTDMLHAALSEVDWYEIAKSRAE